MAYIRSDRNSFRFSSQLCSLIFIILPFIVSGSFLHHCCSVRGGFGGRRRKKLFEKEISLIFYFILSKHTPRQNNPWFSISVNIEDIFYAARQRERALAFQDNWELYGTFIDKICRLFTEISILYHLFLLIAYLSQRVSTIWE